MPDSGKSSSNTAGKKVLQNQVKKSQDFSQITPISTAPTRYEIINLVHKIAQIKEDIPNIPSAICTASTATSSIR